MLKKLFLFIWITFVGSISSATALYPSVIIDDAPTNYWRLGESPGSSTAIDEMGAANGSYINNPGLGIPGALADDNTALNLGGNFPDRFQVNGYAMPSAQFSLEAWMTVSGTQLEHMVSYAVSGDDNHFLIRNLAGGNLSVAVASTFVTTNININDGNYHHIVVNWQSSNGLLEVFSDGVLGHSAFLTNSTLTTGGTLVFGQDQDSVGGSFDFNQRSIGNMDEVAIYDRVLTSQEILAHFNSASVVIPEPSAFLLLIFSILFVGGYHTKHQCK